MSGEELFRAAFVPGYREPLLHEGFVGRERELYRLQEVFTGRKAATVLVAGFRGAGKTALVDEALSRSSGKRQLVVRIAPPHLVRGEGAPPVRSQILRSLARGLYFSLVEAKSVPSEALTEIESAYDKANLTEIQDHRVLERVVEESSSTTRSTVLKAQVDFSKFAKVLLSVLGAALVGTLGAVTLASVGDRLGGWWGVAAGVLVVLLAGAAGVLVNTETSDVTTVADRIGEKDASSRTSKLDLSDATLEHELRLGLTTLAKSNYSVIFVLDELDKLAIREAEEADVQATAVFDILASLKNFFTLGSAVYVFITDDEFFEKLSLRQRSGSYSPSHTIFTDTIYVGPLHYEEIESLIDRSLEARPPEPAYDKFKNFICWESKNHAFDALQILASYEEHVGGKRCLVVSESGEVDGAWREGNLPTDWSTRAALQKHVGVAFDDARRIGPGEALFNQALWGALTSTAAELLDGEVILADEDGVEDLRIRFGDALTSEETSAVGAAVHRMLLRMERYGAVNEGLAAVEPVDGEDGRELQSFRLRRSVPYPSSSIKSDAILLPIESTLVHAFDRVAELLGNAPSEYELDESGSRALEAVREVADQIRRTGPRQTQRKAVVDHAIEQTERLADQLVREITSQVVLAWCDARGATYRAALVQANPRTPEPWLTSLESDFGPLLAELRSTDLQFLLATGESNAVLVLLFGEDSTVRAVQDAYRTCLAGDEKMAAERELRLPIVHVVASGSSHRFPTEVFEYLAESADADGGWSLTKWLFGGRKGKGKDTKEVALKGWHQVGLAADLSNVSDLPEKLTEISFIR